MISRYRWFENLFSQNEINMISKAIELNQKTNASSAIKYK